LVLDHFNHNGGLALNIVSENVTIVMAIGAGMLSFLSPCVLPLFPSYISYITGVSLGNVREFRATSAQQRDIVINSIFFIMGFTAIFMVMGAAFGLAGQLLLLHRILIQRIGGLLIVLFGLILMDVLRIHFLMRHFIPQLHRPGARHAGAFLVGVSMAVGWTPCVGPILGSILSMAAMETSISKGTLLLFAYSLGLALPFFLSAVALRWFFGFFKAFKSFIPWVQRGTGLILVLVGILLLTDQMGRLNSLLIQITPHWLLNAL
jgi:cytochrome c-type biogenesis protein